MGSVGVCLRHPACVLCVRARLPASERQAVVKRHKSTTEVRQYMYASPLAPTENRRHRPGPGETRSIDVTSLAREGRALNKPAGRKRIDTARATGKKRATRPKMPRRAGGLAGADEAAESAASDGGRPKDRL